MSIPSYMNSVCISGLSISGTERDSIVKTCVTLIKDNYPP